MTIDFLSLIFMWLLPLTASDAVTSAPNHNFTAAMTAEVGNKAVPQQPTTWEASTLNTLSKVSTRIITQPVTQKMTKSSTKGSQETAGTTTSKTFLANTQTTALTDSRSPQLNSSTTVQSMTTIQLKITTSTSRVTSQATVPPTTATPTSKEATHTINPLSTRPTPSTNKIFRTSTIPVVNKSTATPKTPKTTTKTPSVLVTLKKKDKDHQPETNESQNGETQSKVVAGIIGSTLVLMFIGFLVIYIKKRKLREQQITTTDWAGPSPFLQDASDNGQVTLRSSNRISLSSFLPQRLSKRLSLLPETDEELTEMTPGTTFGDKHQGTTFGRETDVMEVQETNGTAVVAPEINSKGNAPDTEETSMSSSQTNVSVSTNNNSEAANLNQGQPENPPTSPGAAENSTTE